MSTRVLLAFILLLGASTNASAQKHRRPHAALQLPRHATTAAAANQGASVDAETGAPLSMLPPLPTSPTFVEIHSARVEYDLMLFQPTLVGVSPSGRARAPELFAPTPVKKEVRFFAAARITDDLEMRRDRDRLLLFRGEQPQGAAVGLGIAMFGTATLLAAHAPRPLRVLFDRPIHLGPAVFDGGGMGAGIAGRGL
jgi:hypothetical protein